MNDSGNEPGCPEPRIFKILGLTVNEMTPSDMLLAFEWMSCLGILEPQRDPGARADQLSSYFLKKAEVEWATPPPEAPADGDDRPEKLRILHNAISAVIERGRNYGDVEDNFDRIARRWRAHIHNRFGVEVPLDAVSVALMMDDVKSARLENDPTHLDSWIDKAGYAACGGEVAGRKNA